MRKWLKGREGMKRTDDMLVMRGRGLEEARGLTCGGKGKKAVTRRRRGEKRREKERGRGGIEEGEQQGQEPGAEADKKRKVGRGKGERKI